tara:strand:+ start:1185 stop:1466 length:282 start_codon:yes stop_codon:yes gene_type:complete
MAKSTFDRIVYTDEDLPFNPNINKLDLQILDFIEEHLHTSYNCHVADKIFDQLKRFLQNFSFEESMRELCRLIETERLLSQEYENEVYEYELE